MSARNVFGLLLVIGIVVVYATSSLAGGTEPTGPGTPGDGAVDLYVNVKPDVPDPDPGLPGVWLDTDGNLINGYVLRSTAGIFTNEEPSFLFMITLHNPNEISDGLTMPPVINPFEGVHYLGDVIDPNVLDTWTLDDYLQDLTVTYTLQGQPGTYYLDLIVEEGGEQNPPVLDALPGLQTSWWTEELLQYQAGATDVDPGDTLTFSLSDTVAGLTGPWPDGATITDAGLFSWQVPHLTENEIGTIYEAGVVVTDSFGLTDEGILTIEIIPEPSTIAMLLAGALGLVALWRRR